MFGTFLSQGGAIMATPRSLRIVFGILLLAPLVRANAQNASGRSGESWTASTQTSSENTSPTRTTETHTKIGNRTIHKVRTEVLGPGGGYQPYTETETETVQDDAKSNRSIVRSYSPGPDGEMRLVQVTEEKKQQLSSGDVSVVRTMSNPDEYGNLKVLQREVAETKKSRPGSEVTQSTLYTVDGNGGLLATTKVREEKKAATDGSVQTMRTTTIPDLSGTWQVTERVQGTEKTDGRNRTTESVTFRPDFEGKLSEVSRTTSKESQTDGQVSGTTQTYSANIPGVSPDGRLHLVEQTRKIQTKKIGGTTADQQVERRDPVDDNLKVVVTTSSSVASGTSGTQVRTITSVRGLDGAFSIVSSETGQTTQIPMQVQMSPADQELANPQK
jgi:hypothetical protein